MPCRNRMSHPVPRRIRHGWILQEWSRESSPEPRRRTATTTAKDIEGKDDPGTRTREIPGDADHGSSLASLQEQADKDESPFVIRNELLWKKAKERLGEEALLLGVAGPCHGLLLSLAHKPEHLGRGRTYRRLADKFF